jgi:DNA-binding NtrC family response regulator
VVSCGALDEAALLGPHGAIARAAAGTLVLDQPSELPLELQAKLMRAEIPARLIALTTKDLSAETRGGRLRQDLAARLATAVVPVPALRDRAGDLPVLVAAILGELRPNLTASPDVLTALAAYDWPGNVRELHHVLEGATALAADATRLDPRHLIFFQQTQRAPTIDRLPLAGRTLESIERAAIAQTLKELDGNKTKAAKALGIAASTLYEKIKKYGL